MKQRASADGCLKYEGVPTDGCSQIYVGDIEIRFQNVSERQNSIKHENEYLVELKKKQDQLPDHHLNFMKLVQERRKKMRRFI